MIDDIQLTKNIAAVVKNSGGTTYYVGGYVRDKLLGINNKDIDIEVHGITPENLRQLLSQFGNVKSYGSSFGVFGITGSNVDIAMPRMESCRGKGHRDFDISVDPFIGTYKSSIRRDFTVNALMENVLTGEIVDHFGGRDDLKNKIIRHIDASTFIEDPLRVLRGAQFASRFGFDISADTVKLCKTMDITVITRERIVEELKKALLKSSQPSVFFDYMSKMNQINYWFREVGDLINVPQNPVYHGEGDVWNHTMLVLDEAAKYKKFSSNEFAFMLAALCHDFGKAETTEISDEKITSYSHEMAGIEIARKFLNRLTNQHDVIHYVTNMVRMHMLPIPQGIQNASVKSTNHMFDNSVDPMGLIYLSLSDVQGMKPQNPKRSYFDWLKTRLDIYNEYMSRPCVTGGDLISCGLQPNKDFSLLLEYAHKQRLAGVEKEIALKHTLGYAKELEKNRES